MTAPIAPDDGDTAVYTREPPLPLRPPLLAPEPPRLQPCITCPFRQAAPTPRPAGPPHGFVTATELIPRAGGTGSTTILQAPMPPAIRVLPAAPTPRPRLAPLQLALWLALAVALLLLVLRP